MIKKIVIAGGGTAGWMAAALLSKMLGKQHEIVLIESDDIPTIGVGEATIPPLLGFHKIIGLDEKEFMSCVNATFKLGISFENWRDVGHEYIHAFGRAGQDIWACSFVHFWLAGLARGINYPYEQYCAEMLASRDKKFAVVSNNKLVYAYHMDAGVYAGLLRKRSEACGVKRVEGKINRVNLDHSNGHIESLMLQSGEIVAGDFFVDCTGFRALLIEGALHTGYEDWSHWLPCDRAIAVQTESVGQPLPYTRSIAHEAGWQWRIPLQHRTGNGFVYSSRYLSDEEAKNKLLKNLEGKPLTDPKLIQFRTGTRLKHWNKNCLALGLASGFIEPLESTSIHLIQRSLFRFVQLFSMAENYQANIDEFNNQNKLEVERIRDFIILHYKVTDRQDSAFWRYCKGMSVPYALQQRIDLFAKSGTAFKIEGELFGEESWIQVMLGQGIMPETYHGVVDEMTDQELEELLKNIRAVQKRFVEQLPSHQEFIDYYCRSKM